MSLKTPGYCWFEDDEVTYQNSYGALYNWYTANSGKVCPEGWHVPSDNDWKELEKCSVMSEEEANRAGTDRGTNQGDMLKTIDGWRDGGNGTNETSFSVFPTGWRSGSTFAGFEYISQYWSSTSWDAGLAWARTFYPK